MTQPLKPSEWDSFFGGLFGRRHEGNQQSMGRLGMTVFLASLSVLFLASLAGYLIVRFRAEEWQPPGTADFPGSLWVSTLVLLVSSGTISAGLGAVRAGRKERASKLLAATFVLGVVFLLLQIVAWLQLVRSGVTAQSSLYAFTFYMLTALHGLHVLGGLLPLGVVALRAARGAYDPTFHPGVVYVSMYWHFLDAVWIVLFLVLVLVG